MGLHKGIEVRCDRCGANDFFDTFLHGAEDQTVKVHGWDIRHGKWLCPDCVRLFDELIDKFFDEVLDK